MRKYIEVGWPEIQDYMDKEDFSTEVSFDPEKNVWFVPEEWEFYEPKMGTKEYLNHNTIKNGWEQ